MSCDTPIDSGDTAVMLLGTTLVMLQTPGIGWMQAGMIRRKNSLSMLMQCIMGLVIGSLHWFIFGYSLTFADTDNRFIGDFRHAFFDNISMQCGTGLAPSIPGTIFATTGAWVEKLRFEAFLLFTILWPTCCYCFSSHWVWGPGGWLAKRGALDFAGGLTIHTTSGISALVVASMLQKRHKAESLKVTAHNLPLATIGAVIIWAGWYSFNGASAFGGTFQAANALLCTHMAACTGGVAWSALHYYYHRNFALTGLISGSMAALACVTPASGFIYPWWSLIFGLMGGSFAFFSSRIVHDYFHIDDVLDVFSLQAVPGISGSLLLGFTARATMVPGGGVDGIFYGGSGRLLGAQLISLLVIIPWTAFWTWAIMKFIEYTVGIDITVEEEQEGLDMAQIGESAYDERVVMNEDTLEQVNKELLEAAAAGDLPKVSRLLRFGADPNTTDYDQRSSVHVAAAAGHLRVLKLMHKHGADLDAEDRWGRTCIHDAVRNHHDDVILWLREHGVHVQAADFAGTLCYAASTGKEEYVRRLIKAGADPNLGDYDNRRPLHIAAAENRLEVVQVLVRQGADVNAADRWGNTALDSANEGGHHAIASFLANQGANPSSGYEAPGDERKREEQPLKGGVGDGEGGYRSTDNGKAPADAQSLLATQQLCEAAHSGNLEELKALIKKKANPGRSDYDGRSPLHVAAAEGHNEIVAYLLQHPSVNVNAVDRWDHTPLQEAITHNNMSTVDLLLRAGAISVNKEIGSQLCQAGHSGNVGELRRLRAGGVDLNMGDYDARTALHLASAEGHMDCVRWLLQQGANPMVKDRFGMIPSDDARRHGQARVIEVLNDATERAGQPADSTLGPDAGAITTSPRPESNL